MKTIKIMCTGEIEVDFHNLLDLQTTDAGQSLKKTDDQKIDKLALSIKEYGIVNNLQVWIDNGDIYCFDAQHRKKALDKLESDGFSIPLIPATRCLASNKKEAKKLLLLKESKNSWIDVDILKDYLSDIDFNIDLAASMIEIPDFKWDFKDQIEDNESDILPQEPENIVIKNGDLIEFGNHRLICGDSTDIKSIDKLTCKNSIDLCFTDPMYNDDINPICKVLEYINTDDYLLMCTLKQGIGYINQDWLSFKFDLVLNQVLPSSMLNKLCHYYLHKNILYLRKETRKKSLFHCDNAKEAFSHKGYYPSIIESPKNVKDEHGLSKNIDGIIKVLSGFKADSIIDIFLGGGSTLIACEKTNRKCYGIEINESYCQMIIQRWCDYTDEYQIKINGNQIDWKEFINSI